MRQFGASIQNIGRKAFTAGLAGLSAFALPIKQMMDFDDAIRMTGAVSQSSAEELESLRRTALELGRTTSFTAVQVASLMGELGRAGFKPDEINEMTAAVLNLSRASGTDATLSAGIMAATLRQFSMGASEATRVSNVLTLAANSTFNSVESLGEALSYAGPVAADLGMTLEDTVAILGTLGNVGIQGSNAGTALRRISTMTAAEAVKMRKIFGVEFLDAAGNVRPIITVMGELADATNGLPTGERIAKMNEAFGLLGITGASVMAKAAANTTELANSLRAAGTVAADTAENMDAGPGGTWRILTSAVEGASIAIGTALAPQFQRLGGWITEATGKLTTWITQNEGLIVSAARASGYLLAGGVALIAVGKGFQIAAVGATILNAGLGVVSLAVSGLSSLLGLGSVALGIAATAWTMLSAATASGTIAYSLATGAVAAFQIAVLTLTSTTALAAIAAGAMEVVTIAGSVAYSLATAAIAGVQIALISLTSGQALATVATYGLAAAHAIANGILLAGSIAYSMITWAVAMFQVAILTLASAEGLAAAATAVLSGALSALGAVVVFLTSPLGLIVAGIAAIGIAAGAIGNPITALTGLIGGAATAFSGMAAEVMATASMLMDVYGPAWDMIVAKIKSGDIAGAMRFAWDLAKASFSLGIAYIQQAWGEFANWLSSAVKSSMLTIGDIWGAMWDNFIGVAKYAWAAIKDAMNAVIDYGRKLVGARKIDRVSNVGAVSAELQQRRDQRAQESFDARAALAAQQKTGEDALQSAVDAQLAEIGKLIAAEKERTEAAAVVPPTTEPPALPPAQQSLVNTLMTGTQSAMTARAEAITAVDKNTAEGQRAIYESLDQSGKADETKDAIVDMKESLVDEFEKTRREDQKAPRLAGSRKA